MDNVTWRKSSRSNDVGGQCVELAAMPEGVGVRDSQAPDTGHLTLNKDGFAALITLLKR